MGASESKVLPPWFVSEGVSYPDAISSAIQELSRNASVFLASNPQYFQPFDLEPHMPRLQGALTFDKSIANWYPKLVPKRVSEEAFWRNYFSHVAAIVTEGLKQNPTGEDYAESTRQGVSGVGTEDAAATSSSRNLLESPSTISASSVDAPRPSRSPAVPASALSPPPLHQPSLRPAIPAPSAAPAVRDPNAGITLQHMIDNGRELGASLVAKLAGLHHNLPSHHQLPPVLFAPSNIRPAQQLIELQYQPPTAAIVDPERLAQAPAIRWGIIGCGQGTQAFTVPALRRIDGARIVAVASRSAAAQEGFAQQLGIPRTHTTVAALLADPEVDAVYIATPPGSHAAIAAQVARAEKPCVIEKAFARSGDEARSIVDLFDAARVPCFMNQHKRYLPKWLAVRQLLASHVGTVQTVHYQLANPLAQQLYDSSATAHDDSASAASSKANWRQDCEQSGGGLVMEFGAELFDVLDFLFGPISHVHGDALYAPLAPLALPAGQSMENILNVTFRVGDPSVSGVDSAGAAPSSASSSAPAPPTAKPAAAILCSASFNFVCGQQTDQLLIQGHKCQLICSLFGSDAPVLRFADGRTATMRIPATQNPHEEFLKTVTQELRMCRSSSPASPSPLAACSSSSAVRTNQVLDAALRGFYRNRNDAFWQRPNTWQSAQ